MWVIEGRAQHYDWGDTETIPHVLGLNPDGRPWAEFWWGTHPDAPSTVIGHAALTDVIQPLPFLAKLLAASQPLSLQLHPSAEQAAQGFAADTQRRIYRDPWAKPEMVCALTPFEAVCGMAPTEVVEHRLDGLGQQGVEMKERFHRRGRRDVVRWLLVEQPDVDAIVDAIRDIDEPWAQRVGGIADRYPGDPAAVVVLLLNHVSLQPGDALFLGAGHLHAYLHGFGLEVMGPSDNVVRGGLTSKTVDVDALLTLMRDDVLVDPVIRPVRLYRGRTAIDRYTAAEAPFVVERWILDDAQLVTAEGDEMWWCARGDAGALTRGVCVVVPHGDQLSLVGDAVLYRITAATRHPRPDRGDVLGR
jgi:mannose-6-phosphate isomerase